MTSGHRPPTRSFLNRSRQLVYALNEARTLSSRVETLERQLRDVQNHAEVLSGRIDAVDAAVKDVFSAIEAVDPQGSRDLINAVRAQVQEVLTEVTEQSNQIRLLVTGVHSPQG